MAAVEAAVRSRRLSEARLADSLDRIARLRRWLKARHSAVDVDAARSIVGSVEHQRLLQAIQGAAARLASPG
jgi:hypothetical protein